MGRSETPSDTRTLPTNEVVEEAGEEETEAETKAPTEPQGVSVKIYGTDRTANLPAGTMVWLSATGEKFHNKNDCGRMNPDKARQVTVEEASRHYEACEKCYG